MFASARRCSISQFPTSQSPASQSPAPDPQPPIPANKFTRFRSPANPQWWLAALLCLTLANAATAKDYFLTVGGGYSPTGNQVSLEKNVLLFRTLLDETGLGESPHDVLFSDGNNARRDLQFKPKEDGPKVNTLLARVLGSEKDFGYHYRNHEISGVRAGASRKEIERWFDQVGRKLTTGDRLMIYFTGHGGRGDKKEPRNTKFYVWNTESMKVSEFVGLLDKLPADVPVTLVMVQCFAGGYANVIFNHGAADKGGSPAARCGFYATVHDRVAAGCTADVNEANYQEYSSFFWAALRGKDRVGRNVERPDYDANGVVTFDEAHAYAVLHSNTIDIPVKTSDAFLRAKSKTKEKDRNDLLTAESPYVKLLENASPSEKAILEGLSGHLKLKGDNRAKDARDLASQVLKKKKELDGAKGKAGGERSAAAKEIRKSLVAKWPELTNPWNPQVQQLLAHDAPAIVHEIESHARYSRFAQKYDEADRLSAQSLDEQRRWVKCQRLLRTLDNVALAANLAKLATPEVVEQYRKLLARESAALVPPTLTAKTTP